MYTRCAHCDTWFSITAEHLRQGHGAVRCGSCMRSFDALVDLPEALPEESDPGPALLKNSAPLAGAGDALVSPVTVPDLEAPASAPPDPTARLVEPDEALAPAPLASPDRSGAVHPQPHEPDPEGPPIGDIGTIARAGLRTGRREPSLPVAASREGEPCKGEHGEPGVNPRARADVVRPPPESAAVPASSPGAATLPHVLRDDLDRLGRARRSRRHRWLYAVLSLLFAGLLALQYAWFMPADLAARYPAARPWVRTFCHATGCELPIRRDPTLIRLVSRDVRIHPRYEGALLVTAVLVNTAAFTQPFPDVVFTLYNVNGQTIASRRFTPVEYLGAAPPPGGMAPEQPVQIVLELLAPEEAPVSFEFRFT